MNTSIQAYYDQLGSKYDDDRFGATYGRYIHAQEQTFFDSWLPLNPSRPVLDMGCGTGRFMDRATEGIDFSEGMLAVARTKFPGKMFHTGDITQTGLGAGTFTCVFSMHVIMHLDRKHVAAFLAEAHRLLQPGGRLIFDFPSAKRRAFGQRKAESWHGSNALRVKDVQELGGQNWKLAASRGILFFPIHRFPPRMRRALLAIDTFLCRTVLKHYASYLVVVLEKKA